MQCFPHHYKVTGLKYCRPEYVAITFDRQTVVYPRDPEVFGSDHSANSDPNLSPAQDPVPLSPRPGISIAANTATTDQDPEDNLIRTRQSSRTKCPRVISSDEEEEPGCAAEDCAETGELEMVECAGPACGSKMKVRPGGHLRTN
ncbi:hypothetical protein B0H14DRAFT_2633589 [Mycena olivaceomarginata]|nr:hypothetical protein B0H14DRAFT_2633589 [Mycena olivaceomarginata]